MRPLEHAWAAREGCRCRGAVAPGPPHCSPGAAALRPSVAPADVPACLPCPQPFEISAAKLRGEMLVQRSWLAEVCGIGAGAVVGWRTPYLKVEPATRRLLASLGFLYDRWVSPLPRHLLHTPCFPRWHRRWRQAVRVACRPTVLSSLVEPAAGSLSQGMAARVWPFSMAHGTAINCDVAP